MTPRLILCTALVISALAVGATAAQQQTSGSQTRSTASQKAGESEGELSALTALAQRSPSFSLSRTPSGRSKRAAATFFSIAPMAAPNLPVIGGGTIGHLTKWVASTSSNSFIGDSGIVEDKLGNLTIGSAGSTVTIPGTLQANLGTTVAHDSTLTGSGTVGLPLGISVPLILTGVASGSGIALVTARNSADGNHGIEGDGGPGGAGLVGFGGNDASDLGFGGFGVIVVGGDNVGKGDGGAGILAIPGNSSNSKRVGLAGDFRGNVEVSGTISKTGGSFKIDHPLKPADKYLYHSFVESPDMKNIYDGIVELDARGEATVELPEWFGALNRDFRYQLTCVGGFAPVYIAAKVARNRFRIAGGLPGMEVSWQITGIRQDAWASAHRIPVEEDKSEVERGYYLHPDVFNQPEERGIEWARNPEMMQKIKQQRVEAERRARQEN